MAGAQNSALAIAVAEAGGLGAIACAMLTPDAIRAELATVPCRFGWEALGERELLLPSHAGGRSRARGRLARDARSLLCRARPCDLTKHALAAAASRRPFDADACALVEEFRPAVVSFHFRPAGRALRPRARVRSDRRATCSRSATTVAEATLARKPIGADASHRARLRGGRPSRDVPRDGASAASRDVRARPSDRRRCSRAGHRGRRRRRSAWRPARPSRSVRPPSKSAPRICFVRRPRSHPRIARRWRRSPTTRPFSPTCSAAAPRAGSRIASCAKSGPISALAPAFPNAGPAVAPLKAKANLAQMWSGQAAALVKRGLDATALTRWLASSL